MTNTILTALISPILSGLLMYFIQKSSQPKPRKKINGSIELKPSQIIYILGLILLGIGTFVFSYVIYLDEINAFYVGSGFYILIGGLGFPLYLQFRNHRVLMTDKSVHITSTLGKYKQIKWDDIDYVYQNKLTYYYVLETKKGKLYVNPYLVGIENFRQMILKKTNITLK